MRDEKKTKDELILELNELRGQLAVSKRTEGRRSEEQGVRAVGYVHQERAGLREFDEECRLVVESASEAICITQDGLIKFFNPAGLELTGYSVEELLAKPFTAFVHPDDHGELVRLCLKWVHGEQVTSGHRFRIIDSAGAVKWVESFSASIEWEERPAVLSMIRDVTTHVRTEELLRSAHEELDRKVRERTAELLEINDRLLLEITERRRAEEALREANEIFSTFADQIPVVVFAKDHESRVRYINQYMRDILDCEDWLGGKADEHLPPEIAEAILIDDKKALSEGPLLREEWIPDKRGNKRLWETRKFPIFREGKTPLLGGISIDITERKEAEKALAESEIKYRSLVEASPDPIIKYDLEGNFLSVNQRAAEVFGVGSPADFLAKVKNIGDVLDQTDREKAFANFLPTLKKGVSTKSEYYVRRKDGSFFPAEVHSAVIREANGEPIGFISVVRDMTDRKNAEEALRESEATLRTLLQAAPIGIGHVSSEGLLGWTNQFLCGIVGRSGQELAGKSERILYESDEEFSRIDRIRHSHVLERGVGTFETRFRRKDGTTFPVLLRSASILPGDLSRGIVFTAMDLTERKQMEEQLLRSQKLEAIGTLAGGIAHDVNNLLQVVLGQADMLRLRAGTDERVGMPVEAIRRAALSGAELVKRILTFSRQSQAEMRPVNLSHEVQRVRELLRRTMPRMIGIEMVLEDNLWMIEADPSQVEQILLNLAVNAKDAMPEGGTLLFETKNVTVRQEYCATRPEVKPGKYVMLTVSDTGHGIENQILDRIFEPFFTTKHPGEGTGLGLSMVFGIVKSHGGHINCYSEAGVGTTFKIYFPVAKMHMTTAVADTIEMPAGGNETLLLVDDEDAVRTVGKEMLEFAGYTVLTAANGREALEVYVQNNKLISLVILDLVMPEMSGSKCLVELLKVNPQARILIASGYSADGPTKDALRAGAVGFIGKPFDLKQILLLVRTNLDRKYRKTSKPR